MSEKNSDPSGDILRDITEKHEDQPGDIGVTVTDKKSEPAPPAPKPNS